MRTLAVFVLSLSLAVSAWAQKADPNFDPKKDVSLRFEKGAVVVGVPVGVHLKASFMAVAKKEGPGTLKVGKLPPTTEKDELGDGIWHGMVAVPVSGEGLSGKVRLYVTYQPCTEGEGGVCYAPATRWMDVDSALIPASALAEKSAAKLPKPPPENGVEVPKPVATLAVASQPAPASDRGLSWALLVAFGYGLAASLTPCVYPMIPITMAIVGARSSGMLKGFLLSLTLVLGMAVTYTTLGVVAGLSGAAFGAAVQKPAFLIPVSLLFAAFAFSLFGAFEIALPAGLAARLQGDGSRKGFGGAFLMGLVLGPLAAPCVGPFLGTVLVNIAQHQGVVSGALQLFVFALGMGVLFMAVGTFNAALPKSGEWLVRFKQIMGLVVLGFAAWNVRFIVPTWANFALWSFVLLTGSAVFGLFESADDMVGQMRKGFAALLLAVALILALRSTESAFGVDLLPRGGAPAMVEAHAGWLEQDLEGALSKAKAERKLVIVDIYAEWCAQCKELDEKTWPEAGVKQWLAQNAVSIRIDTDAKRPDLAEKLQIRSYPTVLLLDADGKELKRILGYQKPETMKAWFEGK